MRISSSTMYNLGLGTIQQQYADLQTMQQQVGSKRSFLTPADNPSAAASVLQLTQTQSTNAQFTTNGNSATSSLSLQDTILGQTSDLLQVVHDLAVQAGGIALNNTDRASLATTLQGHYNQLLGLANSKDSNGQYLFSGYQGNTMPFTSGTPTVGNPSGVTYNGDQGQRLMQISSSALVPVSFSGGNVFQLVKNGNGIVTSAAAAANTGSGTVGNGSVLTQATWAASSQNFSVVFDPAVAPATLPTTYSVVDNASGTTLSAGNAYASGSSISIAGAQLSIGGNPAAGDTFTLKASSNQSIFDTLQNMINTLQTPVVNSTDRANLANSMSTALNNLDMGMNSVLTARSQVGAAQNQVSAVAGSNASLATQISKTLSGLQDVDLAKVLSGITQETASLTAAQKSFVLVQSLTLFTYVNP